MRRQFHITFCLLFFLSGFVRLCYEICWIRSASQIFGATTFAVSSVVALFFSGIALGAHYFGGGSKSYAQPLKAYALLEIGVGTFAMFSQSILSFFEIPYHLLYPTYFQNNIAISLIRIILIALIIIPPTFLMGGTLPLVTQFYDTSDPASSGNLAWLYALNTIGAAAGCLVCGFVLLPYVGISTTLLLIGLLAQGIGIFVLFQIKRGDLFAVSVPSAGRMVQAIPANVVAAPAARRLLHAVIYVTGFCALSYELLWTRFLALITHNTVYTYTISLLTTLSGIAVGSYLAHCRRRSSTDFILLGSIQNVSAFSVLASLLLPTAAWEWATTSESPIVVLLICILLMFVPALFSGLSFPLLFDSIRNTDWGNGKLVGRVLSINTAGCVSGVILTGFILLPLLGMQTTLLAVTFLCLAMGLLVIVFLAKTITYRIKVPTVIVSLLTWGLLATATGVRLPATYLANGRELIDFVEGKNAFISVIKRNGDIKMELDRMWQGQKAKGHQIMAAICRCCCTPQQRKSWLSESALVRSQAGFCIMTSHDWTALTLKTTSRRY
ncbi:MAG: fused MFS/spermidine synthase [Geobacter sp.]|nr:fused MFS/spermidine synthase [Geobacter sp.]